MPLSRLALLLTVAMLVGACRAGGPDRPEEDVAAPAPGSPAALAGEVSFRNVAEGSDFVGDAACFDCHEDLWRGYQQHGMARSYYPLTPDEAVEAFSASPLRHDATDFYYRAFEQEGRFYQEEYRLDASGNKTHRLVRRMDYVVGSGHAARTYLTQNSGRLYELPLTWYTQTARWDFSPGYQRQNGRFDRLIPERCMACHNSYPERVPFVEGKYAEVPHGIGCERCHGPGALHVDERLEQQEAPGPIDDTLVNPAHLALDRQLDVCQQCHLNGAVTVFREGRGPYDFRPSQALASFVALFSTEEPRSANQITVVSHADRMKRSRCFQATLAQAEPMTCVTCHNPHEGFRKAGKDFFNASCLRCHEGVQGRFEQAEAQARHAPTADCSGCHMARVEVENAPHSSFTDHWIRVVRSETDLPALVAAHETPELVPYFERDRDGPQGRLYQGMAYLILGEQKAGTAASEKGMALLEEVLAEDPDHGEAQFLLGRALLQGGQVEQAIGSLEQSVQLAQDVPERLHALAQAYEGAGRDPAQIERLYRRALEIQPLLAEVRVYLGRFLEQQGRLEEASAQYQRAADEKPWSAAAHFGLGTARLRQNQVDAAEAALQQALDLHPDHAGALVNLAAVRIVEERFVEAAHLLERATSLEPAHVAALGNLGLVYAQLGRYEEARERLQQVVRLTPGDERARAALEQITQRLKESSSS